MKQQRKGTAICVRVKNVCKLLKVNYDKALF
jgi:hypothetical protein